MIVEGLYGVIVGIGMWINIFVLLRGCVKVDLSLAVNGIFKSWHVLV